MHPENPAQTTHTHSPKHLHHPKTARFATSNKLTAMPQKCSLSGSLHTEQTPSEKVPRVRLWVEFPITSMWYFSQSVSLENRSTVLFLLRHLLLKIGEQCSFGFPVNAPKKGFHNFENLHMSPCGVKHHFLLMQQVFFLPPYLVLLRRAVPLQNPRSSQMHAGIRLFCRDTRATHVVYLETQRAKEVHGGT